MKHVLIIAVLLLSASAQATANQQSWKPVGSSDMRWTFFKLYNVTLLTDDGTYDAQDYPQALEIRYYRNIDSDDLVEATADQWQKLGVPEAQSQQWLTSLRTLWPNIRENDILRFEVDATGANRFLHNGNPIGGVDDAEFASSFLSIWLSPDTTQPKIRERLVGNPSGNV